MKTLFLKSNILHLRTNEGEFEVSNPEVAMLKSWEGDWIKLDDRPGIVGEYVKIKPEETFEWPYGVELIDMLQIRVGNEWKNLLYQKEYKGNMESTRTIKLARLLPPKEEKKENKICIASHGPASTQAESAYKEFEVKKKEHPFSWDGKRHHNTHVESSEPQEKVCKACEIERNDEQVKQMPEHTCKKGSPMDIAQPKSTPSESIENKPVELTEEQRNKSIQEFVEFTSQHVLTFFKMLGLKTHIDCQLYNEPTDERFIFRFYKVDSGYEPAADTSAKTIMKLESENKALREEINALNGDIQSYRNGHEANAKRYNDLLIERNKLGEEIERLKAKLITE